MSTNCSIEGCEKPFYARELCNMHYQRWLKHGDVNFVSRSYGSNLVRHLPDGTSVLTLMYKGQPMACYVDTQDYPLVQPYCWHTNKPKGSKTFYAATNTDGFFYMHRLLRPDIEGEIDHEDRNGLNNRRKNLRPATHPQNCANQGKCKNGITSGYRGVSRDKSKWRVRLMVNGDNVLDRRFATEEEAAHAYDTAVKTYAGQFANFNFSTEEK